MTRIATVLALVFASAPALAQDAFPAGTWSSDDGPVQVERQGTLWLMTDPSDPTLRAVGDLTTGQCALQLLALNSEVPCSLQVAGAGQVVFSVPQLGLVAPLRYGAPATAPMAYGQQQVGQQPAYSNGGNTVVMPSVDTTATQEAASCWGSAGCTGYDADSNSVSYEEPSYDMSMSYDY